MALERTRGTHERIQSSALGKLASYSLPEVFGYIAPKQLEQSWSRSSNSSAGAGFPEHNSRGVGKLFSA